MTEIRKEMLRLQVELETTAKQMGLDEDSSPASEYFAYRLALKTYLQRNERGMFLYLFRRMRMILGLVRTGEIDVQRIAQALESIEGGGESAELASSEAISNTERYYLDKFSLAEKKFLTEYSAICQEFDIGVGVNLREDRQPPNQLMVEVKALKTLGTKVLINGRQIDIQKDHFYFIPRQEAETMVGRGEMIEVTRRS